MADIRLYIAASGFITIATLCLIEYLNYHIKYSYSRSICGTKV